MFFERGRRISRRRIFLFGGDVVCVVGSLLLSAVLRLTPADGFDYVVTHIPTLLASVIIYLLVFYSAGMYEQQAVRRKTSLLVLPLAAVALGTVVNVVMFYARFKLNIGRGILLLAAAFVLASTWLLRRLYRIAVGYGFFMKNALIVGEGRDIHEAIGMVTRAEHDANYKVMGVVTSAPRTGGPFVDGIPVLGQIADLREYVDTYAVETIILARALAREHKIFRFLRPLRYSGVEIMDYVALSEELAQEIPLDHINDEWLMSAAMNSSVVHIRKIKRLMDVAVAVAGLVVSLPVSLLVALIIRLESAGPALFQQRRTGQDGRLYTLYKFRTMRHDAESVSGAVWSMRNDRRVTRVGSFLRKWRLDEIPQLVNVLKGDMSLVGPRPERPEFVETLAEAIPHYKERLLVPPGITGWAQVKYPYAASIEAARRKLQYDLYYIKHMSFFLDALILLRTLRTIIVGLKYEDGVAGEPPEAPPAAAGTAATRTA